jgi:hypothetical protein
MNNLEVCEFGGAATGRKQPAKMRFASSLYTQQLFAGSVGSRSSENLIWSNFRPDRFDQL